MINCHGTGGDYRLEIAETCHGVEEMDDEGSSRWLSMCRKRRGQPGCQNGMSYAGRVRIFIHVVEQVSKTAVLRLFVGGIAV